MPPNLLIDLDGIDLNQVEYDSDQIDRINPQRGHMKHIDGIIWSNEDATKAIGFKDVHDDEFWVEGHIPGRPLFPGVLMIEAAAQLAAFMIRRTSEDSEFIGFIGCDKVKFRGQVVPGQRLLLLGRQLLNLTSRRVVCETQGVVDGTLVFEAKITGMPI